MQLVGSFVDQPPALKGSAGTALLYFVVDRVHYFPPNICVKLPMFMYREYHGSVDLE